MFSKISPRITDDPIPIGVSSLESLSRGGSEDESFETNTTVTPGKLVGKKGSSSSDSSTDSDGPPSVVERINLECLALLATNAHKERLTCTVNPQFEEGSFNVVWFLEFCNGDQWVARVPRAPCQSPMLERRMRSDMLDYELISRRTSIRIPKIFAFSPVVDNILGHPYTLMSRAKGVQLSELWFDREWFTNEHRQTFFHSLAENMAQLKDITYPQIGSLELDDDGVVGVGPMLPSWQDLSEQPDKDYDSWALPGPFVSVHAFFETIISLRKACASDHDSQVQLALLRMFALSLPDPCLDDPPFVLSMPDFGYQNFFVAEDGRISCIIDWDGIEAVPRQGGYARYPSWITRDWDPLMYGYPQSLTDQSKLTETREELKEDAPSVLQQFRHEYLVAYESIDPEGAYVMRNSHIFEAISIACVSWICIGGILRRLTCYAFCSPNDVPYLTSLETLGAREEGEWFDDYITDSAETRKSTPLSAESKKNIKGHFDIVK